MKTATTKINPDTPVFTALNIALAALLYAMKRRQLVYWI